MGERGEERVGRHGPDGTVRGSSAKVTGSGLQFEDVRIHSPLSCGRTGHPAVAQSISGGAEAISGGDRGADLQTKRPVVADGDKQKAERLRHACALCVAVQLFLMSLPTIRPSVRL